MTGFDATLDTDKKSGDLQDELVKIIEFFGSAPGARNVMPKRPPLRQRWKTIA